ncbi:hypothetical protein QBC45DRAFT_175388 [Copromyces sp. CBS 386.78]|nr:hypothetical protein QBC45DRAFT_175388 [Copromyces sp. CBS 386.78]
MGGFALEMNTDDQDRQCRIRNFFPTKRSTGTQRTRLTITSRGLECLRNNGYGHLIPTRFLEYIRDKSKGNTMAKTLVCIQASWFCIQCLTRFAQGLSLAISLLELNTFGHAICTLFIYIMWWHKPLDIAEPYTINFANMDNVPLSLSRLIGAMCVRSELDGVAESAHFYEKEKAFTVKVGHTFSEATKDVTGSIVWDEKVPPDVLVSALPLPGWTHQHQQPGPTANYELALTRTAPATAPGLPPVRLQLAHSDVRRWQLALGYGRLNSVAKNLLVDRVQNLPLLHTYGADSGDRYITFYVGFGLFGLIYGGLHCVAWNAPFVSDLKKSLWRVSSVAIACTSLLLVLLSVWTRFPPFWLKPAKMLELTLEVYEGLNLFYGKSMRVLGMSAGRNCWAVIVLLGALVRGALAALIVLQVIVFFVVKICYDLAVTGLLALYVLARSYLVIISFVNLAHLPDSAFVVPNWSKYVPYIG